jgi:triacylglycerol lipase
VSLRVAAAFHGFLRTGASMWWVARRLRRDGWAEVITPTFGYHLRSLDEHAAYAAQELRALAERHPDATIDVVSHSFGGVLTRATLARPEAPKVRRIVMFCPPNQGAQVAALLRSSLPVHHLGWDPLAQLLPGAPSALPTPDAEVGIIAGGAGDERGFNPWLSGDNDGTVRVEETHLPGEVDHVHVAVQHSVMIMSPKVLDLMVAFLHDGRFPPAAP